MDCIFCKIVKGENPSYKLYEDNDYFAFLDIRPLNPGHALVIPKKHIRWVWDSADINGYFTIVQKIAKAQKKAFNTEYVVSLVFGQEVPHAHVWLIPRLPDDGHGWAIDLGNVKELNEADMKEAAEKIRAFLA